MDKKEKARTYREVGVHTQGEEVTLQGLVEWTEKTFNFRNRVGSVKLKGGYFSNVIDIGNGRGLAISTDGVGTKLLVAQMAGKYDTVGIDCVAMNVNDILCVGAEPVSMVDYIAITRPNTQLLEQVGKGLYEGAKRARINIPGGETAQIKEIIRGKKEGYEFDLVGTAVGLVDVDRIIVGEKLQGEEIIIGFASSGIHSNGFTLARKVLLDSGAFTLDTYIPELGRSLGEELLEPTTIYVPAVVDILKEGIDTRALLHITGNGVLNLIRVSSPVSFVLDNLPAPCPIFSIIQKEGNISDEEMFTVFNMGVGFCLVVPEKEVDRVQNTAKRHNLRTYRIGYTRRNGKREVFIPGRNLRFSPE